MSRNIKYLTFLIIVFILFQFYKFVNIRITNLDLPKGKIVFSSQIDGDNEIFIMNINGLGLKQLTKNSSSKICTATDDNANFSLDGKRIVFVSSRAEKSNYRILTDFRGKPIGEEFSGGSFDIYIMDSDGKNQIPLTYNTISSDPFFSPDGKKVVFRGLLKDNHMLLKMIDLESRRENILNFGGGQIEFSFDGKKLFDNFSNDISIMDINGSDREKITHFSENRQSKLGMGFAVSPDNKKLAIVTIENIKPYWSRNSDDWYDVSEFYTINIDGSDLRMIHRIDGSNLDELYQGGGKKSRLGSVWEHKFSPDGKYILYWADFHYKQGIYLLNPENKKVINLTGDKEYWDEFLGFTFTPDGKRIIFVADIIPENYYIHAVIIRNIKAYINRLLFRQDTPYYDNKYLCIIDMDGKNYRRIAKLPISTELGRDFIHWEK